MPQHHYRWQLGEGSKVCVQLRLTLFFLCFLSSARMVLTKKMKNKTKNDFLTLRAKAINVHSMSQLLSRSFLCAYKPHTEAMNCMQMSLRMCVLNVMHAQMDPARTPTRWHFDTAVHAGLIEWSETTDCVSLAQVFGAAGLPWMTWKLNPTLTLLSQ